MNQKTNFEERTIAVTPTKIIFPTKDSDTSNSFKIIKAKILLHEDESKIGKIITIKGNMHPVSIGAHYNALGEPVYDQRYKQWQFKVSSWTEIKSTGRLGITKYLARECDGIGEVLAERIYSLFGDNSVQELAACSVQETAPKLKISTGKLEALRQWAISEGLNTELKETLYRIGLQYWQIATLMKHYGQDAYRKIKDNCYSLTELNGFGFKTVDDIASKIGVSRDDPIRVKHGVLYSLSKFCDETGSVCCSEDTLLSLSCEILDIEEETVLESIRGMKNDGILVFD